MTEKGNTDSAKLAFFVAIAIYSSYKLIDAVICFYNEAYSNNYLHNIMW